MGQGHFALAFELAHLPATPDGRAPGTDGQLHVPAI
jgi:hypothetical protein